MFFIAIVALIFLLSLSIVEAAIQINQDSHASSSNSPSGKISVGGQTAHPASSNPPSGVGTNQDLNSLYRKVSPVVVSVHAYDSKNDTSLQGTGFFIDGDDVITNYHVVQGSDKIEVITGNGERYTVTDIISKNLTSDLCLMRIDGLETRLIPLSFSATLPKIGDNIAVIGCPEGFEQTITQGIISAIRDDKNYGTVIQIDAAISHGSSGSPVVDMHGTVIGVATYYYGEGQNLNFAISGKQVIDLWRDAQNQVISGVSKNSPMDVPLPMSPKSFHPILDWSDE